MILTISDISTALGVTDFLKFLCNLRMRDFSTFVSTPMREQTVEHDSVQVIIR